MEFFDRSSDKMAILWCCLLWGVLVSGQPSSEGFISIDCGTSSGYSYDDPTTKLGYVSDEQFIDTGTSYDIARNYVTSSVAAQDLNVRSFPDGARNCYTLKPVIQDHKYNVRAGFMYGNYDGLRSLPVLFDLHIGVNFWAKVNITEASQGYSYEVVTVAMADFIQVCLINTNTGTPFVSSLEVRPFKTRMYKYANASQALVVYGRYNVAPATTPVIRYPYDPYDRLWYPFIDDSSWTAISTTSTVNNYPEDSFEPPSAVLQTAIVPVNSTSFSFNWESEYGDTRTEYYVVLYFAEIQVLNGGDRREFDIYRNEFRAYGHLSPTYLYSDAVYTVHPDSGSRRYTYSFNATANSTLPPLINAFEIYSRMMLPEMMTDLGDVDAIMTIKVQYQMKRNWMGDPCAPKRYAWDGVTCSYGANASRITALNLSSSGLTGHLSISFSILKAIKTLDLSYNKLNGTIPDFLANLSSLQELDLTGNCFTGPVPDVLLQRSAARLLTLRIDNSSNTCGNSVSPKSISKGKKITTPVIVVISVVPVVLLAVVVFTMLKLRGRPQVSVPNTPARMHIEEGPGSNVDLEKHRVQLQIRQLTHLQLENITNRFTRVIGQGGFGTVYHGYMEDGTEVAVKLLSGSSSQGHKEFLAEAQNMTKIHHKNLLSLVGYCNDGENLALVYEYMPQGSLHDHLRGKTGLARPLSWRERLQIVLEAAQGLDYLHKGLKQPIIHRDVKTSNILLGHNLEAKIADFGLSKAVLSNAQTHVSTVTLVGTPGYIDPEYQKSLKLSEKSDVYSFGIVLLEIITGEPPTMQGSEKVHILERLKPKLDRGNIDDIVDRRLQGKYDVNSVWKILDLAVNCTAKFSAQRPTMAKVVTQLKESSILETARERSENLYSEDISGRDVSFSFGPSAR